MKFRAGIGFDLHRLEEGLPLILGGVPIPHPKGLAGHSDGDALCHAVTDALLGACGAGTIGEHFPDTDPRFAGASSMRFLADAAAIVRANGFHIANVDANILAEQPRLQPYFASMRLAMAEALEIPASDISVKAKTMERLGEIGRGEAIAAEAVVLIYGAPQ
jgi:2-C-methyl-D-erythritol 2,4-cyclodiphosphate synthase